MSGHHARRAALAVLLAACAPARPSPTADAGAAPPAARDTAAATAAPFRASGNEPFWSVEVGADRMTFRTPDGPPVYTPLPSVAAIPGGRRWDARTEAHRLVVTALDTPCTDDMSGRVRPATVTVTLDGRELRGCGGDPAALLEGAEWVVEDVAGGGVIDTARLTLRFGPGDRLAGRAGCNTYTGRFALGAETFGVEDVAVTEKACAPALMHLEARFLEVLRAATEVTFAADGALVLRAPDGRSLLARR